MEYLILGVILVAAGAYAGRQLYRSLKGGGCGCADCPGCAGHESPQKGREQCCCDKHAEDRLNVK